MRPLSAIESLRARIETLEGRRPGRAVLPFGIAAIDAHLRGGGLARGAVHEIAGGGHAAIDAAAAALFAAGIAARAGGMVPLDSPPTFQASASLISVSRASARPDQSPGSRQSPE